MSSEGKKVEGTSYFLLGLFFWVPIQPCDGIEEHGARPMFFFGPVITKQIKTNSQRGFWANRVANTARDANWGEMAPTTKIRSKNFRGTRNCVKLLKLGNDLIYNSYVANVAGKRLKQIEFHSISKMENLVKIGKKKPPCSSNGKVEPNWEENERIVGGPTTPGKLVITKSHPSFEHL